MLVSLARLAEHFPAENAPYPTRRSHRVTLSRQSFPCQKTDVGHRCEGWVLSGQAAFAAPSVARSCPCAFGCDIQVDYLFEIAREVSRQEVSLLKSSMRSLSNLTAYMHYQSVEELSNLTLDWMWFAHEKTYRSVLSHRWIQDLNQCRLSTEQRLALRWWERIVQLSILAHNEKFTLLLSSMLTFCHQNNLFNSVYDLLNVQNSSGLRCVILAVNTNELSAVGFHSEKHAWLERIIAAIDERNLALCLIIAQPLMASATSDPFEGSGTFRWRSKSRHEGQRKSLQEVLKRGTWDRLVAALARGDVFLKENQSAEAKDYSY